MKTQWARSFVFCLLLSWLGIAHGADEDASVGLFGGALEQVAHIIRPPTNHPPRTFTTTLKILKADGLPKEFVGREIGVAFQAPDHLRLSAKWDHQDVVACRDGQE